MARIAWFVAAAAIVVAALLGWAYGNARTAALEARRAAEAERLKAQQLVVVEEGRRKDAERLAKELEQHNAVLKAEVERVAKLIPGTKVSSSGQLVTEGGVVVNALARPMKPCPECPVCPAPRSPRWVPHRLRGSAEPEQGAADGLGSSWFRPASMQAAPSAPAPEPAAGAEPPLQVRSEPTVVRDAAPRARAAPQPGMSADEAAEVCVLALGDTTNVDVQFVTMRTDAGNEIVVGTATMNRLKPEPQTPLATAKFDAGKSRVVETTKPCPPVKGKGFGLGIYAAGWDGGRTIGPVLALPTLRAFGHSLEASFTVGVAPDFQLGAMAVARY